MLPPLEPASAAPVIVLDAELPKEAFEALTRVDWSRRSAGEYRFNRASGEWEHRTG
jgi:hypothetical protein